MKHLSVLFALLISSCASVPDVWCCRARTVNSGFCTKTISNEDMIVDDTHLLNGKTWIDLKIESVYLPSESWVKIKEFVIKECKKTNKCSKEIASWDRKLNSLTP